MWRGEPRWEAGSSFHQAEARQVALTISKQAVAAPWRRAANAERWLNRPEGPAPEKPVVTCRSTQRRPRLDGKLDDTCWENAGVVTLKTDGAEPRGVVRLAYDDGFLYVAATMPHTPTERQEEASMTRTRDANLSTRDRLQLRFDLDRDYTTAYELTVDHRGWTHDALWGSRHWDPRWFVASGVDQDGEQASWTVEAAIPMPELTPRESGSREAWAVSAERFRPGMPRATWTGVSAENGSPDAYGLLVWE